MGIRLYRCADKGEFRVISTGSCLLSEITGGTRHWFASPGLPITSSTCLPVTHCILLHHVRAVLHVLLVACTANPPLASVTIVISCSRRARMAKSDNNVYSDRATLSHPWLFLRAGGKISRGHFACGGTRRINFSPASRWRTWKFLSFFNSRAW